MPEFPRDPPGQPIHTRSVVHLERHLLRLTRNWIALLPAPRTDREPPDGRRSHDECHQAHHHPFHINEFQNCTVSGRRGCLFVKVSMMRCWATSRRTPPGLDGTSVASRSRSRAGRVRPGSKKSAR